MGFEIAKKGTYEGYNYVIMEVELAPCYHVNGYVKLKDNSKFLEDDYDDIPIECHGGLTFKDEREILGKGMWIGFDTAHYFDNYETKNIDFVENECKNIIEQLIELE